MAITKRVLRLTNTDAVVKVYGAAGSTTITLGTDLKLAGETLGTPAVSITGLIVTGVAGGQVTVTRNSQVLYQLVTDNSPTIDLLEFGNTSDDTNSTHDIVVTTTGAESQLLLKVRKTAGYTGPTL